MTPLRLACALGLALILLAIPAAAQNTIYVDTDASGSETGDSWADAYTSLQDALDDAASTSGDDEIWVAQGTYYPDEGASVTAEARSATFTVPSGVTLRGRFSGDETGPGDRVLDRGVSPTTLSGEVQQDGDPSNNAYHVLTLQGGTVAAVRIAGGTANGTGSQGEGGGAYVTGGTLKRSFLQGNRAKRGSAIYATNVPELRRLLVNDNHATDSGALYLENDDATVNNVTVADNTVDATDGVNGIQHVGSTAQVTNSAFGTATTNAVWDGTFTITGDVDNKDGDNLAGDITVSDGDGNTKTVATNGDGTFSVDVSSDNGFTDGETVDVTANDVTDYQSGTKQVTLDKDNTTKSTNFALDVSTTTTTIAIDTTIVGNGEYPGGSYDGSGREPENAVLDSLVVSSDIETQKWRDGDSDVIITYGDTTDAVTFTVEDQDFVNNTWFMNNTAGTETAPNLRKASYSKFPDEPDQQSNYGSNTSYAKNTIGISTGSLASSYEVRVIPSQSPEGYSTAGEYGDFINGRNRRFTELGSQDDLAVYIQEGNSEGSTNDWENIAERVTSTVAGFIPGPVNDYKVLTDSEMQSRYNSRNNNNIVRVENGSKSFGIFTEGRYIENSKGAFSDTGDDQGTAQEEIFGAFFNMDDTYSNDPNNDTVMNTLERDYDNDGTAEIVPREGRFVGKLTYSMMSDGALE
jgi:hypothetical protein